MKNIFDTKIIIITLTTVILGMVVIFLSQRGWPEDLITRITLPPKELSYKEMKEQEIIISKGKGYQKFSLEENGKKNIIIDYYPPEYYFIPKEKQHDGGIMVFEVNDNGSIKKIWESNDKISLSIPRMEIRDVTRDGKNEILAFWSNGRSENLYIYSWTGSTFILISPLIDSGIIPIFNADEGKIEVKDIDNDHIEEIIVIKDKTLSFDKETLEMIIETYRQIYKWNGQEYYLFKEEKITE